MDIRTAEILTRFSQSWTETEARYDDLINNYPGWERVIPIRQYIASLRQHGADRFFRLGTSMDALLISRSVNFGLRTDQKYIKIQAVNLNDFEITLRNGDTIYRQYRISNLDDMRLEKLLRTLKSTLVD